MISIALCTYNGEKFLPEQLQSILVQTCLPDELVVCDDCSSDRTVEILREFKKKAPFPVHIHQNEINLGSTKNFKKAIQLCTGDIIALCDQDDVWKAHKLEKLAEALHFNPEAGYTFSDADLVDENLVLIGCRLWNSYSFMGKYKKLFFQGEQFSCLARMNVVTGATMAFRASIGKIALSFQNWEENWIHDEWIAIISSALSHPGIPVDEALIFYRVHIKQQVGVPFTQNKRTLMGLFQREMKLSHQYRIAFWNRHCLRILKLKEILQQQVRINSSVELKQNINYLLEYQIFVSNRNKILPSKGLVRYHLIFREAFSGRYAKFSNSWRTMFKDLFF